MWEAGSWKKSGMAVHRKGDERMMRERWGEVKSQKGRKLRRGLEKIDVKGKRGAVVRKRREVTKKSQAKEELR